MAIVYKANRIEGLSTDTKPADQYNGRIFYETDTSKSFSFDGSTWNEISSGISSISSVIMTSYSEDIADFTTPTAVTTSSLGGSLQATPSSYTFVGNWSPYGGGTRERMIDGDFNTNAYEMPYASDVSVVFDFGTSLPRTNLRLKCAYASTNGRGNYAQIQTSPDNVTWTTHHTDYPTVNWLSEFDVTIANPNTNFRYCRVRWVNQQNLHTYFYEIEAYEPTQSNNLINDNTSNHWQSQAEANPYTYVDMGSSSLTSQIALHGNSNFDETEIKIQYSDDAVTWSDARLINNSTFGFTNGQWNFIRFNPVTCRYLRVYGNSGTSKTMAFNQIKVRNGITESSLINSHTHLNIPNNDSSLGFSGSE